MEVNLIGVLETNTSDGTSYIVIPTTQNKDNFNIFKDQFRLKNKEKNTFVIGDTTTGFLYDRDLEPNTLGIFNIVADKGYYTISNINNEQLILFNRNLVKFTNKKNIISNENMFKLDLSYNLLK